MGYVNLDAAIETFVSTKYDAIATEGKAFGKKVKAARIAAAPAIAADLAGGAKQDDVANDYGMSTGSVNNYGRLGILMIVDERVDTGKAYTFISKNDGAPTIAEIREAADVKAGGDRKSVLTILTEIVAARVAAAQSPDKGDEGTDEGSNLSGESGESKAPTYYGQATDALVNLLKEATDVSMLTMDEVNVLAGQVAALAERVRKADRVATAA